VLRVFLRLLTDHSSRPVSLLRPDDGTSARYRLKCKEQQGRSKPQMSEVVEKFRRGPDVKPAPRARRWSLVLTCLGGLIVTGMVGLQLVLYAQTLVSAPPPHIQDSSLSLRPGAPLGDASGDVTATGSLSAKPQGFPAGHLDRWMWFATMGIGLTCGLAVYAGLAKLMQAPSSDGNGEFDTSSRRRAPLRIEDTAEDRRHHGGPIRN
jgi:hypothetical protein